VRTSLGGASRALEVKLPRSPNTPIKEALFAAQPTFDCPKKSKSRCLLLVGSCLLLARACIKTQHILDANCLPTPAPHGLSDLVPDASKASSQAKTAGAEGTANERHQRLRRCAVLRKIDRLRVQIQVNRSSARRTSLGFCFDSH
jgi:hypothetical protein